jgi:S-formylglutathione hydrolase FrmB
VAVEERAPEALEDAARPAGNLVRRTVLGGLVGAVVGGGGYLVTAGVLPGRTPLFEAVGLGDADAPVPQVTPGEIHTEAFASRARRGAHTEFLVALPPGVRYDRLKAPGAAPLPVCVVLHGRGDSAHSILSIGYHRFLASAVRAGVPPFAIAAVDGGDRYWHPRRTGDDSGRMVLDELLPRLAGAGLRAEPRDRVALMGYSMGGYGALLLATQLGKARVAAVVAESPALWTSAGDAAAGAFDDATDFRRHDVFARRDALAGIPVRVDCGLADPFYPAAKEFAEGLDPRPAGSFGRGDHGYGYWRSVAAASLDFAGQALARAVAASPDLP